MTNPVYAANAAQGVRRRDVILAFIGDFCADHGYGPTVREVMVAVGLSSPSTVQTHIDNLVREGLLTRGAPNSNRTLQVVS